MHANALPTDQRDWGALFLTYLFTLWMARDVNKGLLTGAQEFTH